MTVPQKLKTPLLLILLLAFGLRIINLGDSSIWYDEAFSILFSETGFEPMLAGTITPMENGAADIHPIFYYLTLNFWMQFVGQTPFAVRLFGVIIGVITVYFSYRLTRDLFDEKTALATALITAIAPFHVQYSQEARMYSLLALFTVLATWAYLRGVKHENGIAWRWWVIFGIFAGLSMYAHQLAAFYLIALGTFPLFTRRKNTIIGLIFGVFIAFIVYSPWLLFVLPSQLSRATDIYWVAVPTLANVLLTIRSFFTANYFYTTPTSIIGLGLGLILTILLFVQVIIRLPKRPKPEQSNMRYILWLLIMPIALLWLFSQWKPLYLDRALIPSAMMLYVALGWFFTRGGLPKVITIFMVVLWLGAAGIGLYYQYTWATLPKSPFREMTASITQAWQPNDVIIHQDKLSMLSSVYYARLDDLPLIQRYLRDEPGAADDTLAYPTQQTLNLYADVCVQQAANGADRIWWVVISANHQQMGAIEQMFADQIAWMQATFIETEVFTFNDLHVTRYSNRVDHAEQGCSNQQ